MKYTPPFGSTDPHARYIDATPTTPGSNPPAQVFNDVQNELLNLIRQAEIEPADTTDQVYKAVVSIVSRMAIGGPLTAHDFGTDDLTQEMLTEYAVADVWGAGGTFTWDSESPRDSTYLINGVEHHAYDLYDNTWVRNTHNAHRWTLSNKPAPNLIFSWQDVGIDTVTDATDEAAGIMKLYQASGQKTDGAMSQKAVTDLIAPVALYDIKAWYKRYAIFDTTDPNHKSIHIRQRTAIRLNVDGVDRFWNSGSDGVILNTESALDTDQYALDSRLDTGTARIYLDACLLNDVVYSVVSGSSDKLYWTKKNPHGTTENGTHTIAAGTHSSLCAIGNKLYIARGTTSNIIDVHDLKTHANSTITLSASINQIMIRARGTRLFVTDRNNAANVLWYETTDNTKGALVLGAAVGHNSITFIGDILYASRMGNSTTIDTYNLTTGTTGAITTLPNKPWQGLVATGDKLIATNNSENVGYVISPDTGTYNVLNLSTKQKFGFNHISYADGTLIMTSEPISSVGDRYIWTYRQNLGRKLRNGIQYYVYLVPDDQGCKLVVSANSTYPNGYTAQNSRKIASFHTECADIPITQTGMINGVTMTHRLAGWDAGDILPQSITCLTFAPECDMGGMVNLSGLPDSWVSIYFLAGTPNAPTWGYGLAPIRNVQYHNLMFAPTRVKCRALGDAEFYQAAEQSPQKTNVFGGAELPNFVAGGHYDTAYNRMVSKDGVEETNGLLWQVMNEYSSAGGTEWTALDGNEGNIYGNCMARRAGADWGNGSRCGGRARRAYNALSLSHASVGGRAASHTKVTD